MRKIAIVLAAIAPLAAVACSSGDAGPNAAGAPAETTANPAAVARIDLPSGHRVEFFAPPADGPAAVAEVGPIGTPLVLETMVGKKPSEIYALLNGTDSTARAKLEEAETRSGNQARSADFVAPPKAAEGGGHAPRFYNANDQAWFNTNYCEGQAYTTCLFYNSTTWSSQGHNEGRGYKTVGMNGSEATCTRTVQDFYWNGSGWSLLSTFGLAPGYAGILLGGSTAAATPTFDFQGIPGIVYQVAPNLGSWYFKSQVNTCYSGNPSTDDTATVALSYHVYDSPGADEPFSGCETVSGAPCLSVCATCLACPNDSCCNPP